MLKKLMLTLIILTSQTPAFANQPDILVMALFNGHAMIEVNGQQRLLKVGQTSPEGVQLMAANSNQAELAVNGSHAFYPLGSRISTNFKSSDPTIKHNIWPTNGMYRATGAVNGHSMDFLVDTGASVVALNSSMAQSLGIDYTTGQKMKVHTASGTEIGYSVMLDNVELGPIKVHNVQAMVLEGESPRVSLLGMSFLKQLEINQSSEKMELIQKYF